MPRRGRASLVLALSLVLGGPAPGAAEPAGEVRVGVVRLSDALDPTTVVAGPALVVMRQLYRGLVEVSERGDLEPGLASQWSVSRDGLTWTFRLRSDVQFHNGAPVTPEAVVASLGRHLREPTAGGESPPGWSRLFRGPAALIRDVRPGDPGSVQIQLSQPFSPLLGLLAHPALVIAVTQSDSPVPFLGTGPYRVAERTPGRLVLEAVTPIAGSGAKTARLVFQEMDDASVPAALGPRGALDVHFPQSPPAWTGLGLQTLSAPRWQLGLLALRTADGVLARKPVRQAVALGLDPALVGAALGRWARPWRSYLPPGAWALHELPAPTHDPARARRLLASARITSPTLTLLAGDVPGAPDPGPLTEAIRLSLAVAGVKVQVRQPAADTYREALRAGETELALLEIALDIDDPHFGLRPLIASDAAARGSATNVALYRNTVVDDLLLRGSQFAFRPERARLYQRLQALVADDLPYIPLYVRLQWAVARPGLRGLRLDPVGRHRLDRVWLDGPVEAAAPPPPAPAPPALPLPPSPPASP
jgi:peptide/nickel transport system substrate-binding protein